METVIWEIIPKMSLECLGFKVWGLGFNGDLRIPVCKDSRFVRLMESQMEEKMENDMATVTILWFGRL